MATKWTDADIDRMAHKRKLAYDFLLGQLTRYGPTPFKVLWTEAQSWSVTRDELFTAMVALKVRTKHHKWVLPETGVASEDHP